MQFLTIGVITVTTLIDTIRNNVEANITNADTAFFTLITREICNEIIECSKTATQNTFSGTLYMCNYYSDKISDAAEKISEVNEKAVVNAAFITRVEQYFKDEGFKNVKITKNCRDHVYDLSTVINYSLSI